MGLIYEKKDAIAYLTLNRPGAHNAIDPETVVELAAAWEDYRKDDSLRCAVITGAGNETFCSGADLGRLIPLFTGARKPETDADLAVIEDPTLLSRAMLREFDLDKPVVAAINGRAIAGGMELLYTTDIRVAARNAVFGLQEVKWGIVPLMGSTVRLPRQIPYARAMEILLTGELVDADEMLRLGFLNRVVLPEEVMETAERYARIIAENGPLAVRAVKKSVTAAMGRPLSEGLKKELDIGSPVFLTQDAVEGPLAFKEKRKPKFIGK